MRLNNRHLQIQHTNVQLCYHIATNLHPAMRTCISAPRCPSCCPILALSHHLQHRTCLSVTRSAACSAHVASLPTSARPRLNAPHQSTSANSTHQRPTQSSYRHQPAPSRPYMHLRASLSQVAAPFLRFRSICSTGLVCPRHTTSGLQCARRVVAQLSASTPE